MGFLDSLKTLGTNFLANAETALSRVSDKGTFERVVQASYLIAAADGNVDDNEKITLGKVIQRKLPNFKPQEVAKLIEACADECALSLVAGKLSLLDNIQKASSNPEGAKIIMLGVLAVANADGEFSPPEQTMARDICIKIGLSPRDYGL